MLAKLCRNENFIVSHKLGSEDLVLNRAGQAELVFQATNLVAACIGGLDK
jgi:hypothetical protein